MTTKTSKNGGSSASGTTENMIDGINAAVKTWGPAGEYMLDAMQRTILYWDLMRQRSEQQEMQKAQAVPHVLNFDAELVLDARTFKRPANYLLVRIKPTSDVTIDPQKRPFVVVDPRAGHGPGIGGFKADSEIGMAMGAGHPCYFVGFTPEPMPGQTIEDIMHAEAVFLEKVIALHPEAEGKPCVIGNCQAGWAVMMLAATRPELFGPIIVAGSPLSYWAGVKGENPMRYTGGLAGGSWITALTSDLGHGKFDGEHLVKNFENLNPANTHWTKSYDIWANVDKGAGRFLEFEKWWGGHVNLNAEEIQWIVDQLFVGNKLSTAEIVTSDGERIDLRNICSPIICFCSKGDNITPPQQALGWIADLYATNDEIRANGQTIVYAVHESVGHLGIFVSGGVAKKEHQEFTSNIDLIDVLPPGLYEAVMTPKADAVANPELVGGDWVVRFEPRTMDDVRAIVQPSIENERLFATVQRVSEINLGLYHSLFQPLVRAAVDNPATEWLKNLTPPLPDADPFAASNPLMKQVAQMAEQIRQHRLRRARQSPPGVASQILGRDGRCPRRLSRSARQDPGADFPGHLQFPATAITRRAAGDGRKPAPAAGKRSGTAGHDQAAHRRTEIADCRGGAARSGHPQPGLYRAGRRRGGRARLQRTAENSRRKRRHVTAGVQTNTARAVLRTAARPRCRACRHPEDAAGRSCRACQNPGGYPAYGRGRRQAQRRTG